MHGSSKMFLPVIFFFFQSITALTMYKGDSCTLKNGNPGTCVSLVDCPHIILELMKGKFPDNSCGFSGFDSIICCPSASTTTTTTTTTTLSPIGDIARQKCAEYAKSVFVLKNLPISIGNRTEPVNVTQCAIQSEPLILTSTVRRQEFPYMAVVGYELNETRGIEWLCAGTLISESFVLTAAQCIFSQVFGEAKWVRVGDLDLMRSSDDTESVERRVAERIKHPEYNPRYRYHNIALLRLESRVPFNAWIRPACLHTAPSTEYTRARATGWDPLDSNGPNSRPLLRMTRPIVDQRTCNEIMRTLHEPNLNRTMPQGVVEEWMICAGRAKDSDDCLSDTGGSLTVYSKHHCMYDVIGVTSVSKFCGLQNLGIYARVYYYLPWIQSIVWGEG